MERRKRGEGALPLLHPNTGGRVGDLLPARGTEWFSSSTQAVGKMTPDQRVLLVGDSSWAEAACPPLYWGLPRPSHRTEDCAGQG